MRNARNDVLMCRTSRPTSWARISFRLYSGKESDHHHLARVLFDEGVAEAAQGLSLHVVPCGLTIAFASV